ncbi:Iron-dependent repressor IdeR [Frondihabitans sp. 762G35]|uniref:metal-dependent transcriptional regulator n=1 Tax=Frondihabitans sp. 762G35 TaxID=1446794 RepID=UPI000D20C27A|nr:metal-dependent transcriptional regulator [Frondihabitans sp. 762G35]ARC57735.1 Iron-dependent repressor IdeR [Frondihabitans sp. 762G35]
MGESILPGALPSAGTMTEDYVKVIYKSHEWEGRGPTTNELAATLGVAASSVSGNLRKLERDGYIDYEPYGRSALTAEGRALALRMVRRHRLIETWLVEHHGYSWSDVHEEADRLEHAVSERLLGLLDRELGHPERDPHGDPIPRPDGSLAPQTGLRLGEVAAGASGRVVRVHDSDPALLRYLDTLSIRVGTRLRVVERHDFAGSLTLALLGPAGEETGATELATVAAAAIRVEVDPA